MKGFSALVDNESEILILGSMPSVKSLELCQYYGHKQNRFWKVLSAIFKQDTPTNYDDKKTMLKKNHVAVWDIIESCQRQGSMDINIKNAVVNDISGLLIKYPNIKKIYANGQTAYKYFTKFYPQLTCTCLPSTSPANAGFSLQKLIQLWSVIKQN